MATPTSARPQDRGVVDAVAGHRRLLQVRVQLVAFEALQLRADQHVIVTRRHSEPQRRRLAPSPTCSTGNPQPASWRGTGTGASRGGAVHHSPLGTTRTGRRPSCTAALETLPSTTSLRRDSPRRPTTTRVASRVSAR